MLLPRIRPLKILLLTLLIICLSASCSSSQNIKCTRVVDGAVYHGKNDEGKGIWFKNIDERNREFIRKFILDYS
jgi:hypothetical protein